MKTSLLVVLGLAVGLLGSLRASAGEWETDFAKASEAAKKDGKCMLLDFTGSDWCGFCIKLDKEVYKTSEFKEFAKQNLVLVLLDYPHSKQLSKKLRDQNAELAKKYEVKGFPTIVLLSPDGEVVGRTSGYQPGSGPKKFIEQVQAWLGKSKASGGVGAATGGKKPAKDK